MMYIVLYMHGEKGWTPHLCMFVDFSSEVRFLPTPLSISRPMTLFAWGEGRLRLGLSPHDFRRFGDLAIVKSVSAENIHKSTLSNTSGVTENRDSVRTTQRCGLPCAMINEILHCFCFIIGTQELHPKELSPSMLHL